MDRSHHIALVIDGTEYVCIPRAEYEATPPNPPRINRDGTVEAVAAVTWSLAVDLVAARVAAGITQVELARRLKKTQAMVSQAESGKMRVGERYVLAVLKACGLPPDWKSPHRSRAKSRAE